MSKLTLKQQIKKNKPKFRRQNYGALPRIKSSWRKPKGLHSKLRHGFAGHRNNVEPGYGTPAELRHIGKEGLTPVLVHTTKELENIDQKTQGIIVAHTGKKKKMTIIKTAQEKKITILNLKNPEQFLSHT
ncbi:50S ribosomal protein L32e, partial [Candidatus Woesearchaeota archaeon]|nr:50S ribosomal protein L32e [Candidatus Woesearchaeota archaeon]